MVRCPFCQFDNEDGALFCEQCKSDLGGDPVVVATPPAVPPLAEPFRMPFPGALEETIPLAEMAAPPPEAVIEATLAEAPPLAELTPVAEVAPLAEAVVPPVAPVAPVVPAPPVAPLVAEVVAPPAGTGETVAAGSETMRQAPPASPGPVAPPVAVPGPGPLPPGAEPRLVVVRGMKRDMEYPIYEGDNYIGRADEKPVDIDLEDQEPPDRIWSSRQHALITFEGGLLFIEDLNSSNGTFVNRHRLYPGQRKQLMAGDTIQIGTVHMKVKV